MIIRFSLLLLAIFLSFSAMSADKATSLVGSNGVTYLLKNQSDKLEVDLKEGQTVVTTASFCSATEKTLFYKKSSCVAEKMVTVKSGEIKEIGGESYKKETPNVIRFATAAGLLSMAFAVVFFFFGFRFFVAIIATLCAIIATFATAAAFSAFSTFSTITAIAAAFSVFSTIIAIITIITAVVKDNFFFYSLAAGYCILMVIVFVLL